MCGILGFITDNPTDSNRLRSEYMYQGLYVNALRGQDATGVFSVRVNKQAYFIKDTTDARLFLQQSQFTDCIDDFRINRYVAVGHNRKATMGGKSFDNVHPFVAGNICMVHNGTLREYYSLPTHSKGTSDSARVSVALDRAEPGGITVLEKLKGDFAFVWYDARSSTLYLTTNGRRPLSYLRAGDHTFFASEGMMAKFLLSRILEGKLPRITHFKPFHLYSVKMGEVNFEVQKYKENTSHIPSRRKTYTHSATADQPVTRPDPGQHRVGGVIPLKTIVRDMKFPNESTKAARKRLTSVNRLLKTCEVDLQVGDLLSVNRESARAYDMKANLASPDPVGEVNGFMPWVLDGKDHLFYVLVHNCPMVDVYSDYVDTVKATLWGAYEDENGDLCLQAQYKEVGAYRRPVADNVPEREWPPFIRTFFNNERHFSSDTDVPQHEWFTSTCLLTSREMDLLLSGKKCGICDVAYELVDYDDLIFINDDDFVCHTCNSKEPTGAKDITTRATYDKEGKRSVEYIRDDGKIWNADTKTWNAQGKPHLKVEPSGRIIDQRTGEVFIPKDKAASTFDGTSSSGTSSATILTLNGRTKLH